jgi:preprotein translocase SecE subunit
VILQKGEVVSVNAIVQKYEKYVNALFLLAGAIVWLVSKHYVTVWIGYFQLGRKMGPGVLGVIEHGLPILLGVTMFLFLLKNIKTRTFTEDSVSELTKVSWPSEKEVRFGTIIVLITVVIAGIAFGIMDIAFTSLVRTLIELRF